MKRLRLIVSILILITLVTTLGAEVIERTAHSTNASEITSLLNTHRTSDSLIDCGQTEHADKACSDPCHTGQCHLGHCSFIFANISVKYHQFDVQSAHMIISNENHDGPDLEGHRRPPRIS